MSHTGKPSRKSKNLRTIRLKSKSVSRAQKLHSKRSATARKMDNELVAAVAPYNKWKSQKNRLDMTGVDLFPIKTKPNDWVGNATEFQQRIADYFEGISPDTMIVGTDNLQEFKGELRESNFRYRAGIQGIFVPTKDLIIVSPRCTEIVQRGKIKDGTEYVYMEALSHEICHSTRGMQIVDKAAAKRWVAKHPKWKRFQIKNQADRDKLNLLYSIEKLDLPLWIEESSTEIGAQRFLMMNFPMNKTVRKDIEATLFNMRISSYPMEQTKLITLALYLHKGDPYKAVDWIEDLRDGNTITKDAIHDMLEKRLREDKQYFELGYQADRITAAGYKNQDNMATGNKRLFKYMSKENIRMMDEQGWQGSILEPYHQVKMIGENPKMWWLTLGSPIIDLDDWGANRNTAAGQKLYDDMHELRPSKSAGVIVAPPSAPKPSPNMPVAKFTSGGYGFIPFMESNWGKLKKKGWKRQTDPSNRWRYYHPESGVSLIPKDVSHVSVTRKGKTYNLSDYNHFTHIPELNDL